MVGHVSGLATVDQHGRRRAASQGDMATGIIGMESRLEVGSQDEWRPFQGDLGSVILVANRGRSVGGCSMAGSQYE